MKKRISFIYLCCFFVVAFYTSCQTIDNSTKVARKVKDPEMIDHKNMQFGKDIKDIPKWITMELHEIEELPQYKSKDLVMFVFDQHNIKDLEAGKIWMKNFTVASELAKHISQRVKDSAAVAVAGNSSGVGAYMEELVKSVSEANISGLKKEGDYWTYRRFFTADGEVEGDFYSMYMLYSVPRKVLEGILKGAIDKANGKVPAKTQEEIDARALVQKAVIEEF